MEHHPISQSTGARSRLIIAIDSGTTRAEVAFAAVSSSDEGLRAPPVVEQFFDFAGTHEDCNRCPITALYYELTSKLPITGQTLKAILDHAKPGSFDVERYFRLHKLLWHDPADPVTQEIRSQILPRLKKMGMEPEDLLTDWVQLMYMELIKVGDDNTTKLAKRFNLEDFDIEIVVAVPPGRSVIAHETVRNAFAQEPIGIHQVFLVSEPEALFRSWVEDNQGHQSHHAWKIGGTYLVLDGGGGTGCLVRYRLVSTSPPKFEQEFASESINCGAETISNSFEKLVDSKVPRNFPNRKFAKDEARRSFDTNVKLTFGSSAIRLPYITEIGSKPETMRVTFSFEEIEMCFHQCISKLIAGIQRQLDKGGKVDFLVLGGGLCQNDYVQKRLSRNFGSITIRQLPANKGHVAKGAVLTRLHEPFVQSRRVKHSKAVLTRYKLNTFSNLNKSPLGPHLDLVTDDHDKQIYFFAVDWLTKKGDMVNETHEVATESGYETARRRTFTGSDLEFCDTILSTDFHPGTDEWTALRSDGTFVDKFGAELGKAISEEKITWTPSSLLSLDSLQRGVSHGVSYKILRYSIQMKISDVATDYWIKAWDCPKAKGAEKRSYETRVARREALFGPKVSQNLATSLGFDPEPRQINSVLPAATHPSSPPLPDSEEDLTSLPAENPEIEANEPFLRGRFHTEANTNPADTESLRQDHVKLLQKSLRRAIDNGISNKCYVLGLRYTRQGKAQQIAIDIEQAVYCTFQNEMETSLLDEAAYKKQIRTLAIYLKSYGPLSEGILGGSLSSDYLATLTKEKAEEIELSDLAQNGDPPNAPSSSTSSSLDSTQSTRSTLGPQLPQVLCRKRAASRDLDGPQSISIASRKVVRPPEGQRTDNAREYSLGAPRNKGGCWTCLFRKKKCTENKPICRDCSLMGLQCEYGRPSWWYDDELKARQRQINSTIIRAYKTRANSKKIPTPSRINPTSTSKYPAQKTSANEPPTQMGQWVPINQPDLHALSASSRWIENSVEVDVYAASSVEPSHPDKTQLDFEMERRATMADRSKNCP